jgi:hypothetical protein
MNPEVGDLYTYKHISNRNKIFLLVINIKGGYVEVESSPDLWIGAFNIRDFVLFYEKL